MVLTQLASKGLDSLCSKEQLELLDAIDSLRSQGISHYISLPQIIVCGDQSSGKSSVLEAISGVSFPVQSSLCTRFPTELILRKSNHISVKVSIVPHHSRSDEEKASLSDFHEKMEDFQELPALIENAKAAMGIMTLGKAFSKDLLRIEISGPERPHLTIVDLPGLIHSQTKHQSASDIELITDVVQSYMRESRSVILAVVSAKNDYANQIVLKLARKADPRGARTLGVITKPDTLVPGSGSEQMYISLAKNMDVEFRLGWHVLRNRDTDAEKWTLAQRDQYELQFFMGGAWSGLPASQLGIKPLRDRLSKLLLHQIAFELPNLVEEISTQSTLCQLQLDNLGRPRTKSNEQRLYLIQISQCFQSLVQAAVEGTYNDSFFGDAMVTLGYQKRLRAVMQNLSRDFAGQLSKEGRLHNVLSSKKIKSKSKKVTRVEFIQQVIDMMDRSRGRELPDAFNPIVVAELFRAQSVPWEQIAQAHVDATWKAASLFVVHLVTHVADEGTVKMILEKVVEPRLEGILLILREKTSSLLKPHQSGHPITYNRSFTETLAEIRRKRHSDQFKQTLQQYFSGISFTGETSVRLNVSFGDLVNSLLKQTEMDIAQFTACEVLDCLDAYYEVALRRFIDDIAVQVVETCLMAELGQILSPVTVATMSEEEVTEIAGETEGSRLLREELEKKLRVLNNGTDTCRKFAGFRVLGLDDGDDEFEGDKKVNAEEGDALNGIIPTPHPELSDD